MSVRRAENPFSPGVAGGSEAAALTSPYRRAARPHETYGGSWLPQGHRGGGHRFKGHLAQTRHPCRNCGQPRSGGLVARGPGQDRPLHVVSGDWRPALAGPVIMRPGWPALLLCHMGGRVLRPAIHPDREARGGGTEVMRASPLRWRRGCRLWLWLRLSRWPGCIRLRRGGFRFGFHVGFHYGSRFRCTLHGGSQHPGAALGVGERLGHSPRSSLSSRMPGYGSR